MLKYTEFIQMEQTKLSGYWLKEKENILGRVKGFETMANN